MRSEFGIWLGGAVKSAIKGLLIGVVVGAAVAVALNFVAIPLIPALGAVFTPILSLGGSFSMVPMMAFNAAFGVFGGMLSGGSAAVTAYHQEQERGALVSKINELDARGKNIEHAVAASPAIQSIVKQGARSSVSFADAEAGRSESPQKATIH